MLVVHARLEVVAVSSEVGVVAHRSERALAGPVDETVEVGPVVLETIGLAEVSDARHQGINIDPVFRRGIARSVPVVLGLGRQVRSEDPREETSILLRSLILTRIGGEVSWGAEPGVVDNKSRCGRARTACRGGDRRR